MRSVSVVLEALWRVRGAHVGMVCVEPVRNKRGHSQLVIRGSVSLVTALHFAPPALCYCKEIAPSWLIP